MIPSLQLLLTFSEYVHTSHHLKHIPSLSPLVNEVLYYLVRSDGDSLSALRARRGIPRRWLSSSSKVDEREQGVSSNELQAKSYALR